MTESAPLTIRLNAADNVVVARAKIAAGTAIPGEGVAAASDIPAGGHVHTQNCEFRAFGRDHAFGAEALGLGDNEFVPWVIGA